MTTTAAAYHQLGHSSVYTFVVVRTKAVGAVVAAFVVFATFLFFGDDCDNCDNETIAAEAPTTTSTSSTVPDPAANEVGDVAGPALSEALFVQGQLQGFSTSDSPLDADTDGLESAMAVLGSLSRSADADTDAETDEASADGESDTGEGQEDGEGDGGKEGDGTGDGEGEGSTTTTTAPATTTTAAPAPPTKIDSNVPVSGSKIYVNPNGGNDANDGSSEGKALKSLQNALRRVQAGQTVLLMNGDYRETRLPGQLHYFINKSGRADAWIRITNAPGHSPTIVANNGTALIVEGSYIEVSGLTIRGENFSTSNAWGVGIAVSDVHHVRMIGNRISGMPVSGISINGTSNYQVINNTVYENSFWSDVNGSGISVFESKNHGQGADAGPYHDVIVGNRVFRNENKVNSKWQAAKGKQIKTDGNGIIIDSNKPTGYSGRTLIANNLSVDNGGRGILVWDSKYVDVLFNTMYHNGRTGDQLIGGPVELAAGRSNDVRMAYNVAWARPGAPAMSLTENSNVSTDNNYLVTTNGNSAAAGSDKVSTSNPGLRNPTTDLRSADFRPSSGGGLDGKAGGGHGAVSNDMTGASRGGSAEPGAFETSASTGR